MEEKIKEKTKFIDNVAYKSKFQFLIWVNDNVICQRYFKINGFNEESIYSEEFNNCMDGIVRSIKEDLESKSRIFMWYTDISSPMKMQGFLTQEEIDKYGEDFFNIMNDTNISGKITAPDGKVFNKEYIQYPQDLINEYNDIEKPEDGEFIFKFSFLIDGISVYESLWDGNVYPKFVRNGVDLTNAYSSNNSKDISTLSFGAAIIRYIQNGKTNLISDFIRRICETLSNNYSETYSYTKDMPIYKNNNAIDKEKYEAAVAYYGVIKPKVTGFTPVLLEDKRYNYLSAVENYKQSWKRAVRRKTQEYFDNLYPSNRQIEYIERKY